jgi:hypothetical protein
MRAPRNEGREERHPIEELVKEVEYKQRNTAWPDTMINASSVDELLWKGSRRITKVQRVGLAILGLAFVLVGILLLSLSDGFWLGILIATGCILAGCKLLWNSIRKNAPPKGGARDE